MLRNYYPELNLNFLASCPQAQPQRDCEEETPIMELAIRVEFPAFAKLIG
jgi:hypothetical protein